MSKEVFVTDHLHRISDQIAESRRRGAASGVESSVESESDPGMKASVREKMNPETERALRRRHEEFLRLRGDILARLTEAEAETESAASNYRRTAEAFHDAEMKFADLLKTVREMEEPEPDAPDYQIRLAEVFRNLEMIRLEISSRKGRLPHPDAGASVQKQEMNLFSEMASISFFQLFRIGLGIGFPLFAAFLLGCLIIGTAVVLTFRLGI